MLGMVFAGAIKEGVNLSYGNRVIETVRQRKSFSTRCHRPSSVGAEQRGIVLYGLVEPGLL